MEELKPPDDFEFYPEARRNAFIKMKELKESGRRIVGVFCFLISFLSPQKT